MATPKFGTFILQRKSGVRIDEGMWRSNQWGTKYIVPYFGLEAWQITMESCEFVSFWPKLQGAGFTTDRGLNYVINADRSRSCVFLIEEQVPEDKDELTIITTRLLGFFDYDSEIPLGATVVKE